jgi:AMIN domain
MRKQFLIVVLSLLVVALITAAAQTQGAGPEVSRHAALRGVSVVSTDDGVNVEINAHGAVKPHLSTLDHPARVVVDLPNTVIAASPRLIDVYSAGVKAVRLGTDGQTTPNTRIVVDLVQACPYELVPGNDNRMVLKLHTKTAASKTSAPAPAAEAKTEVAAAAPVAAPVKEAKLIEASLKQTSVPSAPATAFAFIEPSYRPKDSVTGDNATPAAIEPPARAIAAAGKFAQRPEGSPLPAASATMQSAPAVNMAAEQKTQAQQAPRSR